MIDPVAEVFGQIGDEQAFFRLVDAFYQGVELDELLRPIYPDDLTDAKKHLAQFLVQRTGGPTTYSDDRGHPRMRGRHAPFRIGLLERNAWMHHMVNALEATPEFGPHRAVLQSFFDDFSLFLINQSA